MTKYKYYKYPSDKIDISKKEPDEEVAINHALKILDEESFVNSEQHQYLKALIIELNKKIKDKKNPVPEIANVISYWLFGDK